MAGSRRFERTALPMAAANGDCRPHRYAITTSRIGRQAAKSRFRNSCGSGDASNEEHDGGSVEEGSRGGDGGFEVLGEPAVAAYPGEEALDHPAAWQHGKADLIWQLADDLDDDDGGRGHPLMIVSGIGEGPFDEGEEPTGDGEEWSAAVAILDARRMRLVEGGAPVGVDERMALAAVDLLAGVIATRPAGLGRLDALAVDDRGRGAGLASGPLAVGHDEGVVDPLEHAAVTPGREPAVDRAPRRKVRWQK